MKSKTAARVEGVASRALAVASILALAGVANASVRHEGSWPSEDKRVSLALEKVPRKDALKKLAEQAGWSLVVPSEVGEVVDVTVADQPADKVLDLMLADGQFVARREGNLIHVSRDASAADAGGKPSSMFKKFAKDRIIAGSNGRVEKGEVVDDLAVFGGSAEIFGTVQGDVTVFGGSAKVREGAHVHGDVNTFGGSVDIEDGARVDGDVAGVGGNVRKGAHVQVDDSDDDSAPQESHGEAAAQVAASGATTAWKFVQEVGSSLTAAAMLFVFGAVLLALGTERMGRLKLAIAARPMGTFSLGIVGLVVGAVAFGGLCVTLVGIPVALAGLVVAIFGAYAGICAVLTTLGELLFRHRTENAYLHLAVGCGLFMALGSLPVIGIVLKLIVALLGIGALVATRGAGLVRPEGAPPYATS